MDTGTDPRTWWSRPGLDVRDGRLAIAGRDAESLAAEHGTPLYAFDLKRVEEQVRALQGALSRAGLPHRVRLAMKAQREPEVLAFVRSLGVPGTPESVGIDACSPGEVLHALANGWGPEEISHTGTNMSDRDLEVLLGHTIHINVDLLSQLDRLGLKSPGRRVGLRLNPRAGAAWRGESNITLYSGTEPGKFGIYAENLDDAVAIAYKHRLTIVTAHFHVGDGFLSDGLPAFEEAVRRVAEMVGRLKHLGCPIEEVNTGGGLGVPQLPGEERLDLDAWAVILARHLGPLDVVVGVEPGDFLVKEAGHLLAEVVTVEDRMGATFVGLDAGWNLVNDHFIYRVPFELVMCRSADAERPHAVTISGHINEGDDLFAEGYPFPPVSEGDVVAILNIGGYNQAMAMTHCLRPVAKAVYFDDRI